MGRKIDFAMSAVYVAGWGKLCAHGAYRMVSREFSSD